MQPPALTLGMLVLLGFANIAGTRPANVQPMALDFDSRQFGGVRIASVESTETSPYHKVGMVNRSGKTVTLVGVDLHLFGESGVNVVEAPPQTVRLETDTRQVISSSLTEVGLSMESFRHATASVLRIRMLQFEDGSKALRPVTDLPVRRQQRTGLVRGGCQPGDLGNLLTAGFSIPSGSGNPFDCVETEHNLYCFNNGSTCTSEVCWTDDSSLVQSMCHFKICSVIPPSKN